MFLQLCPVPTVWQNNFVNFAIYVLIVQSLRGEHWTFWKCYFYTNAILTIQGLESELSWRWLATVTHGILCLSATSVDTQESTRMGRETKPTAGSNMTLIWALSSSQLLSDPIWYMRKTKTNTPWGSADMKINFCCTCLMNLEYTSSMPHAEFLNKPKTKSVIFIHPLYDSWWKIISFVLIFRLANHNFK